MEDIIRRKRAETLVSEAKALLQQGEVQKCVEVCDEALGIKGVGKLSEEVRKIKETAEPILKAWERAANKAASKAKAKDAMRHRMDVEEARRVLNVSKDVELDQLEKAYRRESLKKHPDRNRNDPDATRKFQRVGAAYESLKTIAKAPYDHVKAIAGFREALDRADVHSSNSFEAVQEVLGKDPGFLGVRTQGERRQAYAEYRTQRQKIERDLERKRNLELSADFVRLLDEFKAVDAETTTWETATLLLAREPRYKALPEHRRKEQFDEWRFLKKKQQQSTAEKSHHHNRSSSRRRRRRDDDDDLSGDSSAERGSRRRRSRRRRRDEF